jgi:hypothetical protein
LKAQNSYLPPRLHPKGKYGKVGEMMVKTLNHLGLALAAAAAGVLAAVGMLMVMLVVVEPAGAAFPGQNGKIAFVRNGEIYTTTPNGTELDRLTNSTGNEDYPAWSPGRNTPILGDNLIAFSSNREGNDDIYTMNPLTTISGPQGLIINLTDRLTNDTASDIQPAWSPDGNKIAFVSSRGGGLEIYTMNANGTGVKRITDDPGRLPDWQPLQPDPGVLDRQLQPTPTASPTATATATSSATTTATASAAAQYQYASALPGTGGVVSPITLLAIIPAMLLVGGGLLSARLIRRSQLTSNVCRGGA